MRYKCILLILLLSSFAASLVADDPEKVPVGWHAAGADPQNYEMGIDTAVAHNGNHSGFIKAKEEGTGIWGTWMQSFDAVPYSGKRVKLTAFLKTVDAGKAALWMRIDGEGRILGFDNMHDRPIVGTTDWTQYAIILDVPKESVDIALGVMLTGSGGVWFDDLSLNETLSPVEPSPMGSISGRITDTSGNAVKGAVVALFSRISEPPPIAVAQTTKDGSYSFEHLSFGSYSVAITSSDLQSSHREKLVIGSTKPLEGIDFALKPGGLRLHGIVRDSKGVPVPGLKLYIYANDSTYYYLTSNTGEFSVRVPAGESYIVGIDSDQYDDSEQSVKENEDRSLEFRLVPLQQPQAPPGVVSWISKEAIPLRTVEAGHGFGDMEPLQKMIGDAHLVCLGEATHGTREFFQLKHRMLEFLLNKMGFNVFGIEATFPESFDVNKYVLTGEGDPAKALAGLHFWTWNTQEVLDMIQWMRTYNADPSHTRKVKFYGFDMQSPENAAKFVVDYLRKVDPSQAAIFEKGFESIKNGDTVSQYKQMPQDQRDTIGGSIKQVLQVLDDNKQKYAAASSMDEWEVARQHARIVQENIENSSSQVTGGAGTRDQAMAENIQWILKHEGPGTRMVAWAHNGHVSETGDGDSFAPMGSFLRKALGKDMVIFGFAFYEGSFQAIDSSPDHPGLHPFTIGPALQGSLDEAFALANLKTAALDLRNIPQTGPVAEWFAAPHKTRHIGAAYNTSEDLYHYTKAVIQQDFDALLFVKTTTAAHPVEAQRKKLIFSPVPVNLDFES